MHLDNFTHHQDGDGYRSSSKNRLKIGIEGDNEEKRQEAKRVGESFSQFCLFCSRLDILSSCVCEYRTS